MARDFQKILIIVRHAHRDKTHGREKDNGISDKGRRQALAISRHFLEVYPDTKPLLVSSAKLRCQETLSPLAEELGVRIEINDLLMEKDGDRKESPKAFQERIARFEHWWREKGPVMTVACSHGDWIPACLEQMAGGRASLSKGGWAEIGLESGVAQLEWLLQRL